MELPAASTRESSLLRAIGVLGLAASIVNITIGGGIFRLPADVARALGPAAPLAYLACAVAMGLIVLCFAEAGSRVDLTGGPYAYVETALGPFVGFLAGVVFWIESTLAMAAVSVVFVVNAGQLLPPIAGRVASAAFLVAVFGLLSAVHIAGVRQGTAVNTVAAAAKLLPLVLLLVAGPFFVDPSRLAWSTLPPAAAVSRTSILLVFVFAGIECALAPSGEVRDVARTVPRAIALAMATVTVVYVGLQLVAQGVLGTDLATAGTPLADVAARMFGAPGRTVLLLGATVSMLGYVSGMTLAVPRALFAFARDGFLPRALAAVHPRFRTPHVAIAAQSTIACLLALTSTFERLAILATATTLCLYAACCLAAGQLRRRDVRAGGTPFQVPAAGLAPWGACLAIAWMLTSVTAPEWAALAGALAAASLIFLATARHRASRAGLRGSSAAEEVIRGIVDIGLGFSEGAGALRGPDREDGMASSTPVASRAGSVDGGGRAAPVVLGLERLLHDRLDLVRGLRVGLLCNQATVDHGLRHAADLLHAHPDVRLTTLFGPQHGIRGDVQDNMVETAHAVDRATGLRVFSLYSETREPTAAMLAEVDALVVDLQDVGCRIYTFVYTMANCMRVARALGKKVIVCDRPNPIGGEQVAGNVLEPPFASFVGQYPIPTRHGMTAGELARLFNERFGIGCTLEVVPMEGWVRHHWMDDVDAPWVMPSPNMPTLDTATVFPGTVHLEGTHLSEGRGTTRPFELVGAPYIDAEDYARALNALGLAGVYFRATVFQPTFQKHAGKSCGGVQIHVLDRAAFEPVRAGVAVVKIAYDLHRREFAWKNPPYEYVYDKNPFDVISGTSALREAIETGASLGDITASWRKGEDEFRRLRQPFLLY